MHCDFCGAPGANVQHTVPDAAGDPSVILVTCEDYKGCKERAQFVKKLTAPEPWHTMQAEVSRFINLTI